MVVESHWRSIVKAISWRVIGTLVTASVAYVLTKEVLLSLSIGFADALIKLFVFYAHERLWIRIGFGRKKVKEDYMI